jgi:hypothetical protein
VFAPRHIQPPCFCARMHDSALLRQELASTTHGYKKGSPYLLPALYRTRQPSPPLFSSPFMPSPSTAPSSLLLASFAGHGGAPHRGVPHHTAGAASHSPKLTHAIIMPPQPPVNCPRMLPPLFGASSSSRSCRASAPQDGVALREHVLAGRSLGSPRQPHQVPCRGCAAAPSRVLWSMDARPMWANPVAARPNPARPRPLWSQAGQLRL